MTIPIPAIIATRPTPTGARFARALLPVLLGLALGEMASRPVAAQDAAGALVWQIVEVDGNVRIQVAGTTPPLWRSLATGDNISAKAELEAGGDGRVVLAYDDSRITLSPNSQITLPDPLPDGAVYRVVQRTGTLLFKIVHAAKDKFQVETPYLTTVIKGTTFSVSVSAAGGSVHVTEGAVLVRPLSGEAALVSPGQTARVPAGPRGGLIINGRATVPATNTPAAIVFDDAAGKLSGRDAKGTSSREPDPRAQPAAKAKASGRSVAPRTAGSNLGTDDEPHRSGETATVNGAEQAGGRALGGGTAITSRNGPIIGNGTGGGLNATPPAAINTGNKGNGLTLGHGKQF